jgi:hypothetical protein
MNKTLLYFFGAGASAQALPLASGLSKRLAEFAVELQQANPQGSSNDPGKAQLWGGSRQKLCEALRWLAEEASMHASVDTLAKKLFFRHDRVNLKKLKAGLSAYLVIEQSRKPVDKRYDAFFATILEFDNQYRALFPEDLRIITWNYDTQLEKAFYGFCEDRDRVIESVTFNDHIYRVNGYCGTSQPGHVGPPFQAVWNATSDMIWEAGITLYEECMLDSSSPEPDIRFAWEEPTQNRLANSRLNLSEVSAVVIIGYSFPYFNREIDHVLFGRLSDSQVRRIYLQYPDGVHSSVETRLRSLLLRKDIEVVHIPSNDTDPFYIPDELWQI